MRMKRSGVVRLWLAWPAVAWAEDEVAVNGLGVGMGQPGARYLGSAEVRWRFLAGKPYALGTGGTLLFPTSEGTPRPGAFASAGLGVDHAR